MAKYPKRPRDPIQLAKLIFDLATGEKTEEPAKPLNKKMKALSDKGASKGGKARAEKLSARKRKEIAQKAAKARWDKKKGK